MTLDIIQQIYDYAKQKALFLDYRHPDVMAELITSQAVHESNLLHKPSHLAVDHNNLFGIKSTRPAMMPTVNLGTKEVVDGEEHDVVAGFREYETIYEGIDDIFRIYGLKRYDHVREADSLEEAAIESQRGGYATDPTYAQKLSVVYHLIKTRGLLVEV